MSSLSLLKTSDNGGCKLDCLPFDVLVSILQLPLLDVHTIMLFAELWPHYDPLVTHVLRYYHLPRLYLQSTMDQEGKRKYHTWFHFHSLDVASRRVIFMVQPSSVTTSSSKRYISNTSTAARPQLRQITLHHQHHHQHQHQPPLTHSPITNSPKSSTVDLSNNNCSVSSSSCSLSNQQCPENAIDTTTNKPTTPLSSPALHTTGMNMIQSHTLSLKHGFHTLSTCSSRQCQQKIKQTAQSSTTTTTNNKDKWQFSYRINYTNDPQQQDSVLYDKNDHHGNHQHDSTTRKNKDLVKTEHMYLSPICLTVSLATLRAASTISTIFDPASPKTKSPPSYSWFEKYVKSKLSFL